MLKWTHLGFLATNEEDKFSWSETRKKGNIQDSESLVSKLNSEIKKQWPTPVRKQQSPFYFGKTFFTSCPF